jgi:hypothetical protein
VARHFSRINQRLLGRSLEVIVTVGPIDNKNVGCVAPDVVLYLSNIHHRCGRYPLCHTGLIRVVLFLETKRLQERGI